MIYRKDFLKEFGGDVDIDRALSAKWLEEYKGELKLILFFYFIDKFLLCYLLLIV